MLKISPFPYKLWFGSCFLQIEGAFVQGLGYFMLEEYLTNSDGLMVSEGTWTYKIPTLDTIPKQFNVEILKSGHHQKRVLSSKGMSLWIFFSNANGFFWKTLQMFQNIIEVETNWRSRSLMVLICWSYKNFMILYGKKIERRKQEYHLSQ